MNEEPTDADLDQFANELYWCMEYGEMDQVRQKLRKLIDDAFNRGADE